jgi:hypothetical protein
LTEGAGAGAQPHRAEGGVERTVCDKKLSHNLTQRLAKEGEPDLS